MQYTIFVDLDGTIIKHNGSLDRQLGTPPELLPGVKDAFADWYRKDYRIIITTGRKESMRKATEEQLRSLGIFYDVLLMGLGRGPRVIINDLKPDSGNSTAISVNIKRNEGLVNLYEDFIG